MFKAFAQFLGQYNVVWIAVGLLIATKVGELVKGLIDDVVTPMILRPILAKLRVKHIEEISYRGVFYGKFLSTCIDFLITAFLVFIVVHYVGVTMQAK